MGENKNFKRLVIFGIAIMFIFASVSVAGISVANTKTGETIDEKDNYFVFSGCFLFRFPAAFL